jgi:ABC-type metal ion transport system substrate-binding protein
MKKKLLLLMMMFAIAATSFAQDKVVKDRTKVRKTSTPGQKVHNVFHKHKHYSGYKVKHVKKVEKVK